MEHHNRTGLFYPSQSLVDSVVEIGEIIASQSIISRVMHSYFGILVPLGLLAGILIIVIIIWNKARHHILENLDFYLLNLTITDVTIIIYSFTAITRPAYIQVTNLSCGALAAFFNLSYFYSQNLLLLMLAILVLVDKTSTTSVATRAIQHRTVCVGFTIFFSLLTSVLTVSLVGTYKDLHGIIHCQLDPLNANPEYDFVKFSVGFFLPSSMIVILFVIFLVRNKAEDSELREKVLAHLAVILDIFVIFICRLFYNIMLLRRTWLKLQGLYLYPREELVMNIAELVLFSGSCISLILILTVHRPYRLSIWKSLLFIKRKCNGTQSSGTVEMT